MIKTAAFKSRFRKLDHFRDKASIDFARLPCICPLTSRFEVKYPDIMDSSLTSLNMVHLCHHPHLLVSERSFEKQQYYFMFNPEEMYEFYTKTLKYVHLKKLLESFPKILVWEKFIYVPSYTVPLKANLLNHGQHFSTETINTYRMVRYAHSSSSCFV